MDIQGPYKPHKQGNISKASTSKISLNYLGRKVDIDPADVSQACAAAAAAAYELGETNDEKMYKEEMEEIIEEVLLEKKLKKS